MPSILKTLLFGVGVFVVFITIATILKYASHQMPQENAIFGLFTQTDLMLGLVVAIVVTFSHERKKKIKK